jgi:hypothetical protein
VRAVAASQGPGGGRGDEASVGEKHYSRLPYWKTGCFYPGPGSDIFLLEGQVTGNAHTALSGQCVFFCFTEFQRKVFAMLTSRLARSEGLGAEFGEQLGGGVA